MIQRHKELLKKYLVTANDSDKAVIELALKVVASGGEPKLPIHIETSLLFNSNFILDSVDFTAPNITARVTIEKGALVYAPLEEYIYTYYPQKKQAQDEKWVNYYSTSLKASAFIDLELTIVNKVTDFFTLGTLFNDLLVGIAAADLEAFTKLLKIAIKTKWVKLCIDEHNLSITELRAAVYPKYPF